MAQKLDLAWGKEKIGVDLPAEWHVIGQMQPAPIEAVADPALEVARSLSEPVGMPRLSELARAGMRVVIVMDDGSRPTPVGKLLPAVLYELARGGVTMENVTVVPALGLHRGMSEAEVAERLGRSLEGMRWENPDCDDPAKLVQLGTTRRGSPVVVNKTVAEADLVVSIGCIEPHIIASFGGGYKNLFPGVAGRAMIANNHTLNCTPDTFNMVGQPVERNPMRLDLEEAGGMLKPPVFIINAVLNSALQVVRVVSGHPVQAHRAGMAVSASIYGAKIPRLADVVITDSHPMDSDLRQGVKALANTVRAVRPGGVVITLVRAEEGVGVFGLANSKLPLGRKALKLLAPVLVGLVPKLKRKGLGEEDRFFLYFALQAMRRARLIMYGPTIPVETQANLPFVEFVSRVEEAVRLAQQTVRGRAEVLVFPHGGSTYPILD
ncbi:MAG TPA: nickel-dependent lactate racemase [Anaerolineaceae bacterium]|nr:nickel-dependent lactate racemase [Anaerolineaceae bacterium]